ncbi:MAG: diaminopimelate epimerase [Omnitrophica bacterium]|nr:diaminopimelate epimerase [Candidatus Omnitrophota bacterium]
MKEVEFYKLQASGNDFILVDNLKLKIKNAKLKQLAKDFCRRRLNIGADGLLVIEPLNKSPAKMRIFNSDGSEAEMCGNGARCAALWAKLKIKNKKLKIIRFQTQAGIIESEVKGADVKVKLTAPKDLKCDLPITVLGRKIKINYINTGVPHVVVFVQDLDNIDVARIGRAIREHKEFSPAGANVNFIEVINDDFLKIRTYERGVEAETLACGTGAVASAIISGCKFKPLAGNHNLKVLTKGREVLRVYFSKKKSKIDQVWLGGKAYLVYKGKIRT